MADASHLERMGRELKCPICLSLLNSAVSLTCNHAFCNLCIEKSMKSASDCPVCKVPYRRREIRPAPHMDNLVSIYKSMEVASGVKIFVTQNVASTRNSGEESHDVVPVCATQSNAKSHLGTDRENQKHSRKKGLKRASKTNQTASGSNLVQSSFPNSKRVQVQLHATSDDQIQPKNLEGGIGEIDGNQERKRQLSQKDMPSTHENSEPVFPPFFWLREDEDIEKSTQQTDDNQSMYTPPEAPCFSDIKDSDDDIPSKMSPKRDTCVVSNNLDFIDSEMFDWTQRPCSPELYSDPLVVQTEVTPGKNGAQEKAEVALADATPGALITSDNREGMFKKVETSKTSDKNGGRTKSNKRARNATDTRQSKRAKKTACKVAAVCKESQKVADQVMQKHRNLNDDPSKSKKDCYVPSVQENGAEDVVLLSDGMEPLENGNRTASETLKNTGGEKSGKGRKITTKTFAKPLKCDGELETYINQEPFNQVLVSHSHTNMLPLSNNKEALERGMRNITRKVNSKKISKSVKKVNSSVDGLSKDNSNKISSSPKKGIQGTTDQSGMKLPAKLHKPLSRPKGTVLHKCNDIANKIQCAFCHSSEVSEVSGAMAHYLNGKLAADCQDSRSNAIHVHRNCTEWAPNVYFEGDNVVNLELELSRSRRIKCSCCGMKGAALGCYEKSCRKSFHVRCARLTPECRWDYENFVMLCPLHASCQLPKEIPESQYKQRRKSAVESKSHTHQEKTSSESKNSSNSQWKCKKRFKSLVLCCSALTHIEKGIVSEFEKLSGVTILKNWDSSVTHVIASVDENRACKRTLKFLMGVLEGKWILSVQWIKACMEAGELVDEKPYEVEIDIHGIKDGPGLGRLRVQNKLPRLFDGYTFFFMGDFVPSYKGYLHDLVTAAGGKVLSRKPVAGDQKTFIVYSLELPDKCGPSNRSSVVNRRCHDAEALACSTGAVAASNSWILNSIAGHKLQDFGE